MAQIKGKKIISASAVRRVIGISELLSFAGTWLTRRGKRFTSLATVITLGALIADILGNNIFGYQLPVNKFEMASAPFLAAAVTFGLGGAMNFAAKWLSGADRAAAEANSVCEVREFKQTQAATRKQSEDLWNRVAKYESALVNGKEAAQKEEQMITSCRSKLTAALANLPDDCLARYGVDISNRAESLEKLVRHIEVANPLSCGIEASRIGFIESAVYALNEAMPQMEQKYRIGFDLSQVESYRNWEIFQSRLANEFRSNRYLKSASSKVKISFLSALEIRIRSFGDGILKNLTRNKIYMMAGKSMNYLNAALDENTFGAQPFIWMTEGLTDQIRSEYGDAVLEKIINTRKRLRSQIFMNSQGVRDHVFDCFDADYLRALRLRLAFDVEYAAGLLDQNPKQDIAEIGSLVGEQSLSDKELSEYLNAARKSLQHSSSLITGLDNFAARALKIAHYTTKNIPSKNQFINAAVAKTAEYSDELIQVRIHEYLARQQIFTHYQLIENLGKDNKPRVEAEKNELTKKTV